MIVATSPLAARASAAEDGSQAAMAVYAAGAMAAPPPMKAVLGDVSDHLCRRPWEAAATDAEALRILKAQAWSMGADGLVNVTFDRTRTDLKATCWQSVTAHATAVVFQASNQR
jgi:hypothetical protein